MLCLEPIYTVLLENIYRINGFCMIIFGLFLAVFVGVTLGLVGSGGSILTVPIFVYIFGVDPVLATAYSLFAIGATSVLGGVKGFLNENVDMDKLLKFGVPSMISVFVTRKYPMNFISVAI